MNTHVTPKDFFLWFGAMASLYVSVVAFITLYFQYINAAFPDALDYSYDPYSTSIRFAIATLIVSVPLFFTLIYFIRRDIALVPERAGLWVRKWALYLTLFLAAAAVAVDLITLVYYFLEGEVTVRFLYKVAIVFLVASFGFMHFIADVRGYWTRKPKYALAVSGAVAFLVVISVVAGFLIIGSPQDARSYKLDDTRTQDLQNIQSQVLYRFQQTGSVPASLAELVDPLSGWSIPLDPEGMSQYEFTKKDEDTFELCATFAKESRPTASRPVLNNESWDHAAGRACFERTIDPTQYPLFKNMPK